MRFDNKQKQQYKQSQSRKPECNYLYRHKQKRNTQRTSAHINRHIAIPGSSMFSLCLKCVPYVVCCFVLFILRRYSMPEYECL